MDFQCSLVNFSLLKSTFYKTVKMVNHRHQDSLERQPE